MDDMKEQFEALAESCKINNTAFLGGRFDGPNTEVYIAGRKWQLTAVFLMLYREICEGYDLDVSEVADNFDEFVEVVNRNLGG